MGFGTIGGSRLDCRLLGLNTGRRKVAVWTRSEVWTGLYDMRLIFPWFLECARGIHL